MKKSPRDWALLGRVWAELGSGRITEAFIVDPKRARHRLDTHGFCNDGHITVNPAPEIVDTAIHEILHRLYPDWPEAYVKRTTTYLRRRMSDEEIQAFYAEFQKRARKRKRPRRTDE